MSKVGRFDVLNLADEEVSLTLPHDNRLLEQSIQEHDVALVLIDPIMSVLGEKINASRVKEVRSALDPLVKIADRTGSVLLGIAHFNKGNNGDPTLSISESKAFTDCPRSVFTFARDEENDCRVMSQTKNSLGKDWTELPSLKYQIEANVIDTDEGPTEVGKFVWTGVAERSVGEIVRDHGDQEDKDERDAVDEWLNDYLTEKPQQAGDVYKAADLAGYTKDQAKRGKKRLGILAKHPDVKGPWYWELSPREHQGSKGAPSENPAPLCSLGAPLGDEDPVVLPGSRLCPECDQPVAAGIVRHRACFNTSMTREKSA